jgi:hypothetical protein
MNRKVYEESLDRSLVRLVNDVLMIRCDFLVSLCCIDDYTAL